MSKATLHQSAARLRTALDMFEFGESMMRERLRRERPHATDDEVARALAAWLRTRPGAEHGDSPGRVIEGPRRRR